jgi:hypothetical protein
MQPYNYRPRKHQYTGSLEAEIGGYGGEEVTPRNHQRDARRLTNTGTPQPGRKQIAAAQRQAEIEARARQRNRQTNTGTPPDALPRVRKRPVQQNDDELYEDEDVYQRSPRSSIRWQPIGTYPNGNNGVNFNYTSPPPPPNQIHAIPPRRSASTQQPPEQQYQQEQYTEGIDVAVERPRYRRRTPPWYLLLPLGAVIALILWISGAWMNKWWIDTQNDWTYTQAFRTFSTDAVVGHNQDSSSHPSHFIVQNDKRHIVIIELPADDWSKAIIYSAPTLIGSGQEKTPATISFQANIQTGRLDMVLHVEDQTYLFANNGVKFVTPQGQ